jgi:hypothetical protein
VFFFPLTARLPNQDVSGHLDAAQTQILSLILHAQSMHNRTQICVWGGGIHPSFCDSQKDGWIGPGANKKKKEEEEEKQTQYSLVLSEQCMSRL